MKAFFLATAALALMGGTLSASALEKPDRKIVLACGSLPPTMGNVSEAIRNSTYYASPDARRRILAIARDRCAQDPGAELTFVPKAHEGDTTDVRVASATNK